MTAILSDGCSSRLLSVIALYICTISASPAGFMTVVTATAHPSAVDGLIGLQMAIKVLLWPHVGIVKYECWVDPLGIQRGTSVLSHPSSPQEVSFHLLVVVWRVSLCQCYLCCCQGCLDVLDWTMAIECQSKGIFKWVKFKAYPEGIFVLWLFITGCGWVHTHATQDISELKLRKKIWELLLMLSGLIIVYTW